jgi:diguanylate cyclase (GGDEF)-like protein
MDRTRSKQDRTDAATDRKHAAEDRSAAVFDDLTGAYRRGVGLAELQREMLQSKRTSEPLVVVYIDVDGLKTINDTQGHAAGDNVLCSVPRVLRDQLRDYDLIIRMGGDEFLSVITGLAPPMVKIRFARINAELLALPEHGSISWGIAQLQENESMEELIARADATLLDDRKKLREVKHIQGHRIHR